MSGEDERYDTQELLSMNMDRLKEYMKQWGKEAPSDPSRDSVRAAQRKKRITQAIRLDKKPRVLLVRPDPIHLSQIIRQNDARLPKERFSLSWGDSFASSLSKMAETKFRSVCVFSCTETIPQIGCEITGVDFLLLLNGLMAKDDVNFLLKKRSFVKYLIPGQTDPEKLATFRLLKEGYRNMAFIFLHDPKEEKPASIARRIHGVTAVPIEDPSFEGLLSVLQEVTG